MSEDQDRELRALFQRQRARDVLSTHAFDRVLARTVPRDRSQPRVRSRLAFVGTLALVVVVGTLAVLQKRDEERRASEMLAALTSSVWRAPTDFLLDVPTSELIKSVPTFDASLPGFSVGSGAKPTSVKTP